MPITPADEQRLQAVFEWAKRLFRRKGLTEHNAEDCAAEVRLQMLAHLQQGRTFSFAYAVQVARGVLADFISAQQRHHPTIPLENADWHGGGLIRVHHLGSPPEEKLRISLSTPSTPRQHFTISDTNPNNNTLALRRCLSHKPTSLPTN